MVCFSLGSNLGDRIAYLTKAIAALRLEFGAEVLMSSVYETEGWGVADHPAYLNAVICFNTDISPEVVLHKILDIEKSLGRQRKKDSVDPRTIDIDILFYDDLMLKKENLIIPHPLLKYRKFVLLPLSEIMGEFHHPGNGESMNELLDKCDDMSGVLKTEYRLAL